MLNNLYAADIVGACKYDWWTSYKVVDQQGDDLDRLPGFDADFTNNSTATNQYLYALRRVRVDAASDVWLCSDSACTHMQDVGLVNGMLQRSNAERATSASGTGTGSSSGRPWLVTAASYLKGTMLALPLVGKAPSMQTTCERATADMLHGFSAELDLQDGYGLCFVEKLHVANSSNAFPPVMLPVHTSARGVEQPSGPFGRLMVGTYNAINEAGNQACVRLIMPRSKWLVQRAWDKQHACSNPIETYVFISFFMPDFWNFTEHAETQQWTLRAPDSEDVGVNNMVEWWNEEDDMGTTDTADDLLNGPRKSRVLYCDTTAMSATYTGARCYLADLTLYSEYVDTTVNTVENADKPLNWVSFLRIEGIPLLAYNITAENVTAGAGLLQNGGRTGLDDHTNSVTSGHASQWLFAADMLARDNATVPWCVDELSDTAKAVNTVEASLYVGPENQTSAQLCDELDSTGRLTLSRATKPVQPFASLMQPGLIAWQDDTTALVESGNEQYMGFAEAGSLPAGAVLNAMMEALRVVQVETDSRAKDEIATSDMTASKWGAGLNLYAFAVVGLMVFLTAGDVVRNAFHDVLVWTVHEHAHPWRMRALAVGLVLLSWLGFVAMVMPAPVLALLQEINARKNSPDGSSYDIGYVSLQSNGYGNYTILVVTAYRTVAEFQGFTLVCAAVGVALASLTVLAATGLAGYCAYKVCVVGREADAGGAGELVELKDVRQAETA